MNTLRRFASAQAAIPPATAWYLSDLGEFRGKQELYTRQSPQRLKALREHAMIESAVSSNRIEGVLVDPARVRNILVSPKPLFRDRDEEEVRGYRDALAWIHAEAAHIPCDEQTIKRLHALTRGQIWDAGQYKTKDGDIIERYPDGRERVRFRTVPALETPARMADLVLDWRRCLAACRA
jgi:Fic family protein